MYKNIKNISERKRKLILDAIKYWDMANGNKRKFARQLEKNKWENWRTADDRQTSIGSFKECWWKKSIVIKYPRKNIEEDISEIKREFEQFFVIPKNKRKFFPRIYFFDGRMMVQDKVFNMCEKEDECKMIKKVKLRDIYDYGHNHGHSQKGTVKFFDWVYRRCYPWVEDSKMPLNFKL